MRRLLIARLQSGVASVVPPVVDPPVTPGAYAMLSLVASSGTYASSGAIVAASVPPGFEGDFQFIRDNQPITGAKTTGTGASYTVAANETATAGGSTKATDLTGLLSCLFTLKRITVGLTSALDAAATLSFYGTFATGQTLTLRTIDSSLTGTLKIKFPDGSFAALATASNQLTYTVQSADIAKGAPAGLIEDLTVTRQFSLDPTLSAGTTPWMQLTALLYGTSIEKGGTKIANEGENFTVQGTGNVRFGVPDHWVTKSVTGSGSCTSSFFGGDPAPGTVKYCQLIGPDHVTVGSVTVNDLFEVEMTPNVLGVMNFGSAGTITTAETLMSGRAAYRAHSSDVGKVPFVQVTQLTWQAPGIFGSPSIVSATAAPVLQGLSISDAARGVLWLDYPPNANLDTSSVPATSDFSIGGAPRVSHTVTGFVFDNSANDTKRIGALISPPALPSEDLTFTYTGTAIRYPGGSPAATFSGQAVYSDIPPLSTTAMVATSSPYWNSPSPGVIAFLDYRDTKDAHNYCATMVGKDGNGSKATGRISRIQMSILDESGNSGITRQIGFDLYPPTSGQYMYSIWAVRRVGNTVAMFEAPPAGGTNAQVGSSYTFNNPGTDAHCLAAMEYNEYTGKVRSIISTDGGDTWTTLANATRDVSAAFYPYAVAWSSSSAFNVTGIYSLEFA